MMMDPNKLEQTLVLIKPDGLKNSLTGYMLSQLSEFHTGLHFSGTKIVKVSRMLAEEHYAEHRGKVFFDSLLDYIMGVLHYPDETWRRRVIAIVYQGPGAIQKIRDIAGPTNPLAARENRPGCIRALGTLVPITDANGKVVGERMDNLIHASANKDDAEKEIKLWFRPNDMPPLMHTWETETSDSFYYYKEGNLLNTYETASVCLFAPGDVAWISDLEILQKKRAGTLESVAAKYWINT
jgi:nucleoside-diphosphate kinase